MIIESIKRMSGLRETGSNKHGLELLRNPSICIHGLACGRTLSGKLGRRRGNDKICNRNIRGHENITPTLERATSMGSGVESPEGGGVTQTDVDTGCGATDMETDKEQSIGLWGLWFVSASLYQAIVNPS